MERLPARRVDSVAAVLIEPMLQGAGGMIVWPAEFVAGVRRLCDQYKTLLIADEVLTGFGRTGKMFACEHAGITPDIICLSKALTAGYLPLGVTADHRRRLRRLPERRPGQDVLPRPLLHGQSAGLRGGARQPGSVSRRSLCSNACPRLEQQLRAGFEPLRALGDVRVIGGVAAVELDLGQARLSGPDRSAAGRGVPRSRPAAASAGQRGLLHAALLHHGIRDRLGAGTDRQRPLV